MPPNAWGDFFAGSFAPLAFLWLVLGYLQQGEELNLSTRALQLQAEELKNSVEQQRALVEVTRQQVESERAALEEERQLRVEQVKPKFLVGSNGGTFYSDGKVRYNLTVSNTGSMAARVVAELTSPKGDKIGLINLPIFANGCMQSAAFDSPAPLEGSGTLLRFTYKDALGRDGSTIFSVRRQSEHPQSDLEFTLLGSDSSLKAEQV